MKFTKMHGLGNDYVYVDCFEEQVADAPSVARAVSDRHRGIGSDGLILICPSDRAPVRMEMYNADGSRAQMCGNGIRCVAKYAYDHGLIERAHGSADAASAGELGEAMAFARKLIADERGDEAAQRIALVPGVDVETDAGVLTLTLFVVDGRTETVCVDMGRPSLAPADMPARIDGERVVDRPLEFDGRTCRLTLVSMGNPHAIAFVEHVDRIDLPGEGSRIENDPRFPERVNAHFVQIASRQELITRTWERGSGATQACGTGACAAAVAAAVTNRADRSVTVRLPGGPVHIRWAENDHVHMTGPATEVFSGKWPD